MSQSNPTSPSKKNRKTTPVPKLNLKWPEYAKDDALGIQELKDVLEKVTLYKKLEYCPHGDGGCEKATVKEVVKKIIEDVNSLKLKEENIASGRTKYPMDEYEYYYYK